MHCALCTEKMDFIDELLSKTDIVELIREYVPLEEKGGYWACCPFHNENTASFRVYENTQTYYCFGACQKGGNALTFVKEIENIDYADAIKLLAKKTGLEAELEASRKNFSGTRRDSVSSEKKDRLLALMRFAAKHYHENLYSPQGAKFKKYLTERGIQDSIIKRFGIGASFDSSSLIAAAEKQGFTKEELQDCNVAQTNEKGIYDPFYDRLIIPIINQFGQVCAFGGRTLIKDPDFAKYRNSTNTAIFEKNKTVFAINLLQKLKKSQTKIDYAILCEGYMDVIALQSHGFNTAVASMGTALTLNQAKQIKNFTTKVFISFDGDTAGQKNALAGLDVLAAAGLNVRVVQMPKGLDPDDVVKQYGAEGYQKLLDNAITLPEFKIKSLLQNYDLADLEQKAKFTAAAVAVIKRLENTIEQEEYFKRLSKLTGYDLQVLRRQADKAEDLPLDSIARLDKTVKEKVAAVKDKNQSAKDFILASIAADKDYVDYREDFSEVFTDDFSLQIANYFVANKNKNTQNIASLYTYLNENEQQQLDYLLNKYPFKEGDTATKYGDCIVLLKKDILQKRNQELLDEYKQTKNPHLLDKMQELTDTIQSLKNKNK